MSVPYEIKELDTGVGGRVPKASEKIPIIAQPWVSDRAKKVLDIVWTALNPLNGLSSYTDCCV
jgi:acyl-CoA dehydrogenase